MKKIVVASLLFLAIACKKKLSREEVQSHLTETMSEYLNNEPKTKGIIDFEVKSVAFFEENDFYLCEFKIRMRNHSTNVNERQKIDTTGVMKAKIDKNFVSVNRIY